MAKLPLALSVGALALGATVSAQAYQWPAIELIYGNADQETRADGYRVSEDDMSLGLRLSQELSPYVAWELARISYGDLNDRYFDGDARIDERISTSSINFGLRAQIPLEQGFSLIGRFGLAKWDYRISETDSDVPGDVLRLQSSGTDIYYGIGLKVDFTQNLFFNLSYDIIEMNPEILGVDLEHDIKHLNFGIGYRF